MMARTLLGVLATVAVAALLLAGVGVHHARSAARLLVGECQHCVMRMCSAASALASRHARPSRPCRVHVALWPWWR